MPCSRGKQAVAMELLLTLVTDGITQWPSRYIPAAIRRFRLGTSLSFRYAGSQPSIQIKTTVRLRPAARLRTAPSAIVARKFRRVTLWDTLIRLTDAFEHYTSCRRLSRRDGGTDARARRPPHHNPSGQPIRRRDRIAMSPATRTWLHGHARRRRLRSELLRRWRSHPVFQRPL